MAQSEATLSKSYRTEPESLIANRNAERDSEGRVILPRIVERKPRRGDVHPLPKKLLSSVLHNLPPKYIYGLSRIELRARETKAIGQPYGVYLLDEKAINLYSLPVEYELEYLRSEREIELRQFGAIISKSGSISSIRWSETGQLSHWYYCCILAHEIGHHFRNQYKQRRKIGSDIDEELVADLHAKRLTELFVSPAS